MTDKTTEQLVIERAGSRVVVTLNLASDYAAIETYDKLIAQARDGYVLLDVETEVHG